MSNNGLDDPVPSEQPPANPAVKKDDMILLPGAYLDSYEYNGETKYKVVYGEMSCSLWKTEQTQDSPEGLLVPKSLSKKWKNEWRWQTYDGQKHIVPPPAEFGMKEAYTPTKPAEKKEAAKQKLTQVLDEAEKAGYTPEQMEIYAKNRLAKMQKKVPPRSETAEAEAEKPAEKFDEEDAIRNFHSYFPSPADFDAYEKMADWMIKRGYGILEYSKKSKEQQQMELELQLMFCKDLNIPPSFAKSLYIVNGKPEMQIDLMMYLIARGCPTAEIEPISYTKEKVSMRARRNRTSPWITATWTLDDAKANVKGFEKKDVWKNMPAQMLRSRVLGELGRTVFYPELRGLAYVAGEISDNAPVDDKALPAPPVETPKKSFPVKMPAKEPETKMATEDLTTPPVVPYVPDQTKEAEAELESITNEPLQPEEEAPEESPKPSKKEDAITLMNKLKDAINKGRPKEQTIGLPVIKKGVEKLSSVSHLTNADQAKALLGMDLSMAKLLLGIEK